MTRPCACGGARRPGYVGCDACYQAHIQRIVDTFPPLTDEQRDKIRVLLRPSAGAR